MRYMHWRWPKVVCAMLSAMLYVRNYARTKRRIDLSSTVTYISRGLYRVIQYCTTQVSLFQGVKEQTSLLTKTLTSNPFSGIFTTPAFSKSLYWNTGQRCIFLRKRYRDAPESLLNDVVRNRSAVKRISNSSKPCLSRW